MHIPADAVIDSRKLSEYLLVPLRVDDKSGYLARAGFSRDQPHALENAIRQLCAATDAVEGERTEYGTKYLVTGTMTGPNGRELGVLLIWQERYSDQKFHFVTLVPANLPAEPGS